MTEVKEAENINVMNKLQTLHSEMILVVRAVELNLSNCMTGKGSIILAGTDLIFSQDETINFFKELHRIRLEGVFEGNSKIIEAMGIINNLVSNPKDFKENGNKEKLKNALELMRDEINLKANLYEYVISIINVIDKLINGFCSDVL